MDKPLNKLDLVAFEKLKLKWKELSAEVCYKYVIFKIKIIIIEQMKGYYIGWTLFKLYTTC